MFYYLGYKFFLYVPAQRCLNHDLVDGFLDRLKLALQLSMFASGDAASNDRSGDVAGTAQSGFGFDEDIRDVLE